MLQTYIPFLPKGARRINDHVAIYRHDSQIEFYTASGPIFSCSDNDLYALRLAQGIVGTHTQATPAQLARALNVNPSTVYRNLKKYAQGGPAALIIDKGNRDAYKLSVTTSRRVQKLLNKGYSLKAAARQVGVTEGCIRYAIKKGKIFRDKPQNQTTESSKEIKSSSRRSTEDRNCRIGIAAKRDTDRVLASNGKLLEAEPSFSANEGVRHAGALLALPVLASLGVLDAGKKVYGSLQKGFYGLHAILLALAFMALLRIKTPEQLKGRSPGDLGIILGLDRFPEVKTLRRKLKEMGLRNKAGDFVSFLARRWTALDKDTIGFVYIDGHVRPYHGRKHKLPKTHVARRRLCMPATTDFWVNDEDCEPLFFVTAKANDSLLSILENEVIANLKALAGEGQRVTLIFDREGWSPKRFEKWFNAGIDVITYRKGRYSCWSQDCFIETKSHVGGKPVKYLLGERSVKLRKNFWMREVRRLCDDGHQTSVMTTRQDLDFERIAHRMFSRWNQENYFRYMREEYAIDHLVTNEVEQAEVERLVSNPDKKEKRKAIAKLKRQLETLKREYADKALKNDEARRPTMRGFNIANAGDKRNLLNLEKEIETSQSQLKQMPDKIAVKHLLAEHEIVRLETDRKMLTDAIKMSCYRAETALLNLMGPHFARNKDEGRAFLKSVFQQPADIIPDEDHGVISVNFHTMSNPRSNLALKKLCTIINQQAYIYPGTRLKLVFNAG